LALFATMTGVAMAAAYITGKNIKDGTVLTGDIAYGTLPDTDFSLTARNYLTTNAAQAGPAGRAGSKGLKGDAALRPQSFHYFDTGKVKSKITNPPNPVGNDCGVAGLNNGPCEWWDYNGTINNVTGQTLPLTAATNPSGLLQLSNSATSAGQLEVRETSDIVVMGTLSVWHWGNVHSRIECYAQVEDASNPSDSFQTIGQPTYHSSDYSDKVVNVGVVAGATIDPGNWSVRIVCRDVDRTGQTANQWLFSKGNMIVLAAKTVI
jgi:hypothetical protein